MIGINRGGTYGLFDPPEPFLPRIRELGGRFARVNLFWSQLEPERGAYDWTAADALFDQLEDGDELWVTVVSSSRWATRRATAFLPPSPPTDPRRYQAFVGDLVRRAAGRVRYWQCEIEPCLPLMWSGTAQEYTAHLRAFHDAVKAADPGALVALGGAVPGMTDFLEPVLRAAGPYFDVFDLHPYGDADAIPALVRDCRERMAAHGYDRPVAASEFNGPLPTAFPENLEHLAPALAAHRRQFLGEDPVPGDGPRGARPEPDVVALLERAETLPPTLRMFLPGCPPELEAERHRLACRDLAVRVVLLRAAGVEPLAVFQLAPEFTEDEPLTTRALMFGTFALTGADGRPHPPAETFRLLARHLRGAVRRLAEGVYEGDGGVVVAWGDGVLDLPYGTAHAVDATGSAVPLEEAAGGVRVPVTTMPVLVIPGGKPC